MRGFVRGFLLGFGLDRHFDLVHGGDYAEVGFEPRISGPPVTN